jgi:hypothetical protein
MNALAATPRPWREPRSHVRADGLAKVAYSTEREAIAAARLTQGWYLCSQNPSHWHLTRDPR